MIITPQELKLWIDEGKPFIVVDFRPKVQRRESPLSGLNAVIADADTIPMCDGEIVLVCQFGIVTEEIIVEKDLDDTFSLLGGIQAWEAFQNEKQDMSRYLVNQLPCLNIIRCVDNNVSITYNIQSIVIIQVFFS